MSLEIITSDLLSPIRHGFFTRKGGASSGVFAGLNCGLGSTDQAEAVLVNRGRVAQAMQVDADRLVTVKQVHSARAVVVKRPFEEDLPEADALVTDVPGLALGVLTADCQPVLFADASAGIVGAAHAGWRGAVSGVLEATVQAMVGLGAQASQIKAVIGPSISQANYEVGPEMFDEFMALDPDNARFFANGQGDRLQFDLPGFGLHKLRQAGVGEAEWCRHCTYADEARFYSFRRATHRAEADFGRLIAAISL